MARAKQGDSRAFGELVRRYETVARRVAAGVAGSDADDVVQDSFVKAYRSLHRFRDGSPFRPWLLRIVANEARNARRASGRRLSLALRSGDADGRDGVSASAPSAEDDAAAAERRAAVATALVQLPDRDRLVLVYRWFAGLTEAEMATALGCRPGTVKSRLSRAHERMRAALAEEGRDG
ncbi:MAG TPA: RNA polymerase sigma factor [Acidimicrobiales bacterium]